ncbi:MAG: TetR/AcrR family transcriptional regulator [Chloroflexota bacterium]
MRRIPKQARSKAKVDAIVQAAAEQLQAMGYEGLSTVEVAKQAGVSVGTLYQFFDNKDDLMEAIAEDHVKAMETFRSELFSPDAIYVPSDILIDRTIDWLVDHNIEHPTFHQIFNGSWNDTAVLANQQGNLGGIVSDIATILRHHAPDLPEARIQAGAAVLVYVTKGMLGLLRTAVPAAHPVIVAEIKQMMLTYFNDLVAQGASEP